MSDPYSDRIEAVARAICLEAGFEPDKLCRGGEPQWTEWKGEARAADQACLAAIEEPTPEMISAGADHKDWGRKHFGDPNYAPSGNIYTAMIRAIPRAKP